MKFLIIASFVILSFSSCAKEITSLTVGDNAPDFKLPDETGAMRTLSEFSGQKVVLYFYPKDDTPGCTKEACSFRDHHDVYAENGIVVIGASYDSPESHKQFKQKYNLPFILISDSERKLAKAYGAYGKFAAQRYTFLIREDGTILRIFTDVDVTTHAEAVLKAFGIEATTVENETQDS